MRRGGYPTGMDPTPTHGTHLPDGTHRQPDLDDELAADGLDLTPRRDEIEAPGAPPEDDLVARSELATYLLPSAFPARTAALLATARQQQAPPEILERLEHLPDGTYGTVQEVWTALGGASEHHRPTPPHAAEPSREEAPVPAPELTSAAPAWVDAVADQLGWVTAATVRVVLGGAVSVASGVARRLHLHRSWPAP